MVSVSVSCRMAELWSTVSLSHAYERTDLECTGIAWPCTCVFAYVRMGVFTRNGGNAGAGVLTTRGIQCGSKLARTVLGAGNGVSECAAVSRRRAGRALALGVVARGRRATAPAHAPAPRTTHDGLLRVESVRRQQQTPGGVDVARRCTYGGRTDQQVRRRGTRTMRAHGHWREAGRCASLRGASLRGASSRGPSPLGGIRASRWR